MTPREREVLRLHRNRPRDRVVRLSAVAFVALVVGSWCLADLRLGEVFSQRRSANFMRFLQEATPAEVHDLAGWWAWASELLVEKGLRACRDTLAISVASISLAGFAALLLAPLAARSIVTPHPFLPAGRAVGGATVLLWKSIVFIARGVLVFLRSIPEYVWAFLLLAMLGPVAWPAVLALAMHNSGILGKLIGEAIENVEPSTPRALRGIGATRSQLVVVAILPTIFPRFLLYFFYRWETCVREATVLGLLGFSSLGYWIQDARARDAYDQMVFFVALGAVLVLAGDLLSIIVRAWVRRGA